MKKFLAVFLASAVLISGCSTNDKTVLREKILPDFENLLEAYNEIYLLYEDTAAAADEYINNPSDETKAAFVETEEVDSRLISEYFNIESTLDGSEESTMEKYNISAEDYNTFFEYFEEDMQSINDWASIKRFINNGSIDFAQADLNLCKANYDYVRKYLYYGIMYLYSETGSDNIEYIKELVAKYPKVYFEDIEWLTDRDEITAKTDELSDNLEEIINEFGSYIYGIEDDIQDGKYIPKNEQ